MTFFVDIEKFSNHININNTNNNIINDYPEIGYIRNNLSTINEIEDEYTLTKLFNQIQDLQTYYLGKTNPTALDSGSYEWRPFSEELWLVRQRMEQVSATGYCNDATKIIMTQDDEVNGYKLYNIDDNIFTEPYFNSLEKIWNENNNMTFEEFYEKYDDEACSDWSKQDEHGECYGGFWKYPKGSYEYENAYDLTRKKNGEKLYELPYPKEFLLHTIKLGCNNRQESVRWSNYICEWMKRKIDLMKKYTQEKIDAQ